MNYRTGENVDTWLGLLEDYAQKSGNYPEGYTTIDGLRYQLQETDLFDDMLETGFNKTHNVSKWWNEIVVLSYVKLGMGKKMVYW